ESSAGSTVLTVACVPTGMNAGVSTTPCGVVKRPSRASLVLSRATTSNRNVAWLRMCGGLEKLQRNSVGIHQVDGVGADVGACRDQDRRVGSKFDAMAVEFLERRENIADDQ